MDETEKDDTAEAKSALPIPLKRRVGRFTLDRRLINDQSEALMALFARRMIVVRCELMYYSDSLEYMAICEGFDPVPTGGVAPWYDMEFSYTDEKNPEDRTLTINFRRMG